MKGIKRRALYMAIIFVVGIAMIFYSSQINETDYSLSSMGVAFVAISAVRLIQYFRLFKDKEKLKKYELINSEERVVFIANKSRSLMFAITIYIEVAIMIVYMFKGNTEVSSLIAMVAGVQTLGYFIAYMAYNKKY